MAKRVDEDLALRVLPGGGQTPSELWVYDVKSSRLDRLFPGRLVTGYDLSRDDRVVACT